MPIPAHAAGEDSILYRTTSPVLSHDPATDALARVRWNNEDRSVLRTTRSALGEGGGRDAILRVYDALRMWNQFLTSADSEYWVQLTPGTLVGKPSSFLLDLSISPFYYNSLLPDVYSR